MASLYFALSALMVALLLLSLIRVHRGPSTADRMMAAQLISTTVAGTVLLIGHAVADEAARDVALVLVLLGALSMTAFVRFSAATGSERRPRQ